ncbi:ferritin-like protein [Streptomyces sp. NPDC006514]|uniref:ferritin-like domain-containing protein n=1 Tax=Streptomyces sp. NPDC006514 TaxID=3154308 RepID=UPI0033AAC9B2
MSYLGFPRLNFTGVFQSDVATANNAPPYYDNSLFEPRMQWLMRFPEDIFGLWNPGGTNAMRLTDVKVTSGLLPDGTLVTDPGRDRAVGGRLMDDDLRANGKFVDLDPADQTVPEIWGLRPRLVDAKGRELLRGDYLPTAVEDLWMRSRTPPEVMPDPSGTYQTVLSGLEWADADSPLLRALRERTDDGLLSIKFTLDSVDLGVAGWSGNVSYGRIVGAIGPYRSGEPKRFLAGRRLRRTGDAGSFNHAPCRIDEESGTAFLDLANSIATTKANGPLVDTGELSLAVLDDAGKAAVLAPLKGVGKDFYEHAAGIATVRLSPEQLKTVARRPIAVVEATEGGAAPAVVLSENADATWIHADQTVHRLYPGVDGASTGSATLYATQYGAPAAGRRLFISPVEDTKAVAVPTEVVTGNDGRAEVKFTGKDPANARKDIDGVVAMVAYGSTHRPGEPEGLFHLRVFDAYKPPARPTWVRDVQPIFQQYANLFPVMRDILDLGNYNHVLRHSTYIKRTMLAPLESPNHMPVSRDLSLGKRDMIVSWLNQKPVPTVLDITNVDDLRQILQQAILVELATVPPYLAALFSIKPNRNVKIAELIRGVVLEEMQHMAQVCNLLNAVGGKPQIGRPGLVPTYPGKLPGPVLPDVEVHLRKLSLEHVKEVFMGIEQPEYPTVEGKPFRGAVFAPQSVRIDREGRVQSADGNAMQTLERWFTTAEYRPLTIGWLYNQIARAIVRLDKKGKLFTGDPKRQVAWPDAPQTLYQVTDKRSALLAIYQIIEQGEGSPHDLDGDGLGDPEELGHYYRFEEIVKGRQLMKKGDKWVYEGPEIPFDPDGVYPVVDDADTFRLPANSDGRRESARCDESYTNLLKGLHRVFNGHPEELDNTVGLMFQVQVQAKKLMSMPSAEGAKTVLGAAFQSPGQ